MDESTRKRVGEEKGDVKLRMDGGISGHFTI